MPSETPSKVAFALWFHDAVLDPQAGHPGLNEPRSAAWAARSLVCVGANGEAAQHAQLVFDIDLDILGSPAERFERYDQDERKEYAWMPGVRYVQARAEVRPGFLRPPRPCHGKDAAVLLGSQARINLAAALSRLAQ